MASSAAKVAKRIPLIKFPNRRGGETQAAKAAVSQAAAGEESKQAMSTLNFEGGSSQAAPSGTAFQSTASDENVSGRD